MRECSLPAAPASLAARSLAACVAAILELDPAEVPCPSDGDAWQAVDHWLATRNLAPVAVRDPESFQWGGFWIARFAEPYVVMAGTPSGLVWAPAGTGAAADAAVVEGFVLAAPALRLDADPVRVSGTVVGVFRAAAADAPIETLAAAVLVAGVGVVGDRYATGLGRFSRPRPGT